MPRTPATQESGCRFRKSKSFLVRFIGVAKHPDECSATFPRHLILIFDCFFSPAHIAPVRSFRNRHNKIHKKGRKVSSWSFYFKVKPFGFLTKSPPIRVVFCSKTLPLKRPILIEWLSFFFLFFSFQKTLNLNQNHFFDFFIPIPLFRQHFDFDSEIKRTYSTSINNWVQ